MKINKEKLKRTVQRNFRPPFFIIRTCRVGIIPLLTEYSKIQFMHSFQNNSSFANMWTLNAARRLGDDYRHFKKP